MAKIQQSIHSKAEEFFIWSVKICVLCYCHRWNEQGRENIKFRQLQNGHHVALDVSSMSKQRFNSDIFSYPRLLVSIICISKNANFLVQEQPLFFMFIELHLECYLYALLIVSNWQASKLYCQSLIFKTDCTDGVFLATVLLTQKKR